VEKDCQFGCLNFSYKSGIVSPMTAYRNKWPSDRQQQWLYHTVTPPAPGESHPLATKELPPPPFMSRIRRIPPAPRVTSSSSCFAGSHASTARATLWRNIAASPCAPCSTDGR
jgi:hypothetical protein